jgi:hypothetical protein
VTDSERVKRIREEILKAKEVAGINPPMLVPRGDAFRSATSSRPLGAMSHERDLPQLRGFLNDDVLATGPEPTKLPKSLVEKMGKPSRAVLGQIEMALEQMESNKTPSKLREAVANHLNMMAAIHEGDKSVAKLSDRFDALRFGRVTFKDQDDLPGGAGPND